MDRSQSKGSNVGHSQLAMPSQSVIDSAVADLLADMQKHTCTIFHTKDTPPSAVVDDWATAVASTADTVRTKLQSLIKVQRLQRNACLPINRLPFEPLALILRLVIEDQPAWARLRQVPPLSLVASRWKAIVDETPAVWATVCDSYPPATISKILLKSQRSPLAVESANTMEHGWHQPKGFFPLLQPHIYRLKTMDLRFHGTSRISRLTSPAPMLRSLHLTNERRSNSTDIPINIFSGSAERLEDLSLQGIQITWEGGMLKGLRSLCVSHIKGPRCGLTSAAMLQILAQCPELGKLELVDIDIVMTDERGSGVELHLPRLHRLQLKKLPPSFIHLLVSMVTTPQVTSLALGPPVGTDGEGLTTLLTGIITRNKASDDRPENIPRLQSVALDGMIISWAPGLLKGLKSLVIENITQGAPTYNQLLDVIQANPCVEVLRLCSLKISPTDLESRTHSSINLSQLKELELHTLPSEFALSMVSVISAPQLSELHLVIEVRDGQQFPSTMPNPLKLAAADVTPVGSTIEQVFSRTPSIEVTFSSDGDILLYEYKANPPVSITLRAGGLLPTVALVKHFLSLMRSSDRPISVVFDDATGNEPFPAELLREISIMLPQTTHIDFGPDFNNMRKAIKFLATPIVTPGRDHVCWPLPKLSNIFASSRVPFQNVLEMVESRAGHRLAGKVELPSAFENLIFLDQERNLKKEEWQAVEAVVGKGVFGWDMPDPDADVFG